MKRIIQRAWGVQAVRVFAVSGLLYFLAFQICSERFWRDPHSAFFNSDHVYEFEYTAQRRAHADNYISHADGGGQAARFHRAGDEFAMCAAFVTVKRDDPYYAQAVGTMLMNLTEVERELLYVYTLFGNTDPTEHPDWEAPWVEALVDKAESYEVKAPQLDNLRQWEKDQDFQKKGLFDYRYALRKCYDTGAPYIAMLEDDIIFAEGWFAKTLKSVYELDERFASAEDDWIYLRLFFTETFMLWTERDFWYRNMWLAFGLCIFAVLGSLLHARRRCKLPITNLSIAVICLVTVPAFVAMFFMIGKYSLAPFDGIEPMDYGGCCSQALVFPRAQVPALEKSLEDSGRGQTDMLIEDYSTDKGLKRFALAPQVVQHVGRKSSRGMEDKDTISVWAFHFEAYHRKTMHEEHQELAEELAEEPAS